MRAGTNLKERWNVGALLGQPKINIPVEEMIYGRVCVAQNIQWLVEQIKNGEGFRVALCIAKCWATAEHISCEEENYSGKPSQRTFFPGIGIDPVFVFFGVFEYFAVHVVRQRYEVLPRITT